MHSEGHQKSDGHKARMAALYLELAHRRNPGEPLGEEQLTAYFSRHKTYFPVACVSRTW